MRSFTEEVMKIEVAPWIKDCLVDMKELYTELSLEKINNKPIVEETSVVEDYRELFYQYFTAERNKSDSVSPNTNCDNSEFDNILSQDDNSPKKTKCFCFGKMKSKQTKEKEKVRKLVRNFDRNNFSTSRSPGPFGTMSKATKILAKGDPGIGKTTLCKKIGQWVFFKNFL